MTANKYVFKTITALQNDRHYFSVRKQLDFSCYVKIKFVDMSMNYANNLPQRFLRRYNQNGHKIKLEDITFTSGVHFKMPCDYIYIYIYIMCVCVCVYVLLLTQNITTFRSDYLWQTQAQERGGHGQRETNDAFTAWIRVFLFHILENRYQYKHRRWYEHS